MEKILIKPTAQEIVLKGKPEDGHVDVFSYNYEGASANSLGGLFLIGHVQPANEDTSYMVNLIASLAKREYYAKTDIAQKEAFSRALKKINEVLQDFFKNKDLRANIGIFAIAGESILISRLGKFKIILARDEQNIDILNNITLFTKEHIQEKEFSNVISGKIMPNDKLFAFYPSRSMTAREKNIKSQLVNFSAEEFINKINSIKKENENFSCAALHITVAKHTEPAIMPAPQPQELRKPQLTPRPVLAKSKIAPPVQEENTEKLPDMRPPAVNSTALSENIKPAAAPSGAPLKAGAAESRSKELENSNVYYPNSKGLNGLPETSPLPPIEEESPLIIPSEFSSATQDNFLLSLFKKLGLSSRMRMSGSGQNKNRKKLKLALAAGGIALLALVIGIKFFSIPAPAIPGLSNTENNELINEAEAALQSARTNIEQNNLLEARKILRSYYEALDSATKKTEKLNKIEQEIIAALDEIDKSVEVSPTLVYQIAPDFGDGSLLHAIGDKVIIYTTALDPAKAGGFVLKTNEGNVETNVSLSDFNPSVLFGVSDLAVMIDDTAKNIGSLALKTGDTIKTLSLDLSSPGISFYPYQENLYILTQDTVYKINDAVKGNSKLASWLEEGASLPANPIQMAVDGKIYILNESGILTTYFKGEKSAEVNTSLPVEKSNRFLTTPDSLSLYLVDNKLGRIYVLDKQSGSLLKTIKLNNDQPLVSASISEETGTIYFLTGDNKVWKVSP